MKTLIRLLISIILVLILVQGVEWEKFSKILASVSPFYLFVVVIGYVIGQLISAYKWLLIIKRVDPKVTYLKAFKAYFSGMLVNVFGLGTVGGDMTRALLVSEKDNLPKATAVASVLADRIHGLTVLLCIGLFSVFVFGSNKIPSWVKLVMALCGLVIIIGWFIAPKILIFLRKLTSGKKLEKLVEKLESVYEVFPQDTASFSKITLISVAFHCIHVYLHFIMAEAIGVAVPLAVLFVAIPFVNILSSLPFSWQGLGVRESSYTFFLAPAFLNSEQCLAMGLLWLITVTLSALIGALVPLIKD